METPRRGDRGDHGESPSRGPEVVTPEHVVSRDELPRGPATVANAVDHEAWQVTWWHSETEALTDPKRGGGAYGLVFRSLTDQRHGWACWVAGSYVGAFVYTSPRSVVPRKLKAAELKLLLGGEG